MWALRRASKPLGRVSCQQVLSSHSFYATPDVVCSLNKDEEWRVQDHWRLGHLQRPFVIGKRPLPVLMYVTRNFSALVGKDKEDELDNDVDFMHEAYAGPGVDDQDKTDFEESEDESEDHDNNGTEFAEATDESKLSPRKGISNSPLFKMICNVARPDVSTILDKWIADGNTLEPDYFYTLILILRKRKSYFKAMLMMDWLVKTKPFEVGARAYVSLLDLIAKARGLHRAEMFIEEIPESFRGEMVYRTLLANCAIASNPKKAEEVFNKMKKLGLPMTIFSYNQLLLVYKRVDQKKLVKLLVEMENEGVKPSEFTYKLLIDAKGIVRDIAGMEQVLEMMEADGVERDLYTRALIAKHYINAGQTEKAEAELKAIESGDITHDRAAFPVIIPLFATLRKADDVERVWKLISGNARFTEYLSVMEAWGRLGKVEKAEEVHEAVQKRFRRVPHKLYSTMLGIYANHKLVDKGKQLAQKMLEVRCRTEPETLNSLVKLYIGANELEKADSVLHEATQRNRVKPFYVTYLMLLECYANRGDVHNAEKVFSSLRQSGYAGRIRQYELLLEAYINAKARVYGFRERLKADNLVPNRLLSTQLASLDPFKRTPMSELLA